MIVSNEFIHNEYRIHWIGSTDNKYYEFSVEKDGKDVVTTLSPAIFSEIENLVQSDLEKLSV